MDSKLAPEFEEFVAKARDIYNRKGQDYTIGQAEQDRLANFRATAEMLGISMMQAWAVHFYKHVSAIFAYCKTGKTESEGIEGRLLDIMNYAILGNLITKELNPQLELPIETNRPFFKPKTQEELRKVAQHEPPNAWAHQEPDGWDTQHPKLKLDIFSPDNQ